MGYHRFKQKISGRGVSGCADCLERPSFALLLPTTRFLDRESNPTNRNIYSTHSGF